MANSNGDKVLLALLATGPNPGETWRCVIPSGKTIRLGRKPAKGWSAPWDQQISREHADMRLDGGALLVVCVNTAKNLPQVRGASAARFSIEAGEEFSIGETIFRLEPAGLPPADNAAGTLKVAGDDSIRYPGRESAPGLESTLKPEDTAASGSIRERIARLREVLKRNQAQSAGTPSATALEETVRTETIRTADAPDSDESSCSPPLSETVVAPQPTRGAKPAAAPATTSAGDGVAAGAPEFNPYASWLGIAGKQTPPDHYTLLGVEAFETDLQLIQNAGLKRLSAVRRYSIGKHLELSQLIMNEIAGAIHCLTDEDEKAAYDKTLRQQRDEDSSGNTPPAAAPQIVDESPAATFAAAMRQSRSAMIDRDFVNSHRLLEVAEQMVSTADEAAVFDRLSNLATLIARFWQATRQGLMQLNTGDPIEIQGVAMYVLERDAEWIRIRFKKNEFRWPIDGMPTGLAIALATRVLPADEAETWLIRGAIFAVDPRPEMRTEAIIHWRRAASMGADVSALTPVLDDDYSE